MQYAKTTMTETYSAIEIEGEKYPLHKIVELCEQDAWSTDFGASPVFMKGERRLEELGLLNRRTRGSYYATDTLRDIVRELYPGEI